MEWKIGKLLNSVRRTAVIMYDREIKVASLKEIIIIIEFGLNPVEMKARADAQLATSWKAVQTHFEDYRETGKIVN